MAKDKGAVTGDSLEICRTQQLRISDVIVFHTLKMQDCEV